MDTKRTRKIQYDIANWDEITLTDLKSIDCKYHIFGILQKDAVYMIKGFMYFTHPKTINKLQKDLANKTARFSNQEFFNVQEYSNLDNVWEKGTVPLQGRKKKENIMMILEEKQICAADTSANVTNALMTQNNTLIEQSKEICQYLMKQNQQLLEENKQLKTVTTSITNNFEKMENTTNIENKTFNINVFLNEDCKNAITLTDFINTLKIEDSDLFFAKERGLGEAIINIFERGLKNCDINTRPVHCTDTKRETLHIKDEDGWIRESGHDSARMKDAIDKISNKKIYKLSQYMKEHPEGFGNVQSPNYEDCLKMLRGVMGADEDSEKTEKKVLKNIAKTVYINGQTV
jgi:hypothetical protein